MLYLDKVKEFIEKEKRISFPQVQSEFGLDFKSMADIFNELCHEGCIKYCGGIDYEYIPTKEADSRTFSKKEDIDSDDGFDKYSKFRFSTKWRNVRQKKLDTGNPTTAISDDGKSIILDDNYFKNALIKFFESDDSDDGNLLHADKIEYDDITEEDQKERHSSEQDTKDSECNAIINKFIEYNFSVTKEKAVLMAEGCLCAARGMGNDTVAAVYENVIYKLKEMSNYEFNRLKSQI